MFNNYRPNFKNKFNSNKGRGNFRVKGPIKSFRDLEVYNKSTSLSADIFTLQAPQDLGLEEEVELLKNISKHIPKMIAESYGNRFDNFGVAERKLEKTAEIITSVISKLDFILSVIKKTKEQKISDSYIDSEKIESQLVVEKDNEEIIGFEKKINKLLKDYSTNRAKVLNLKRSWIRLNEKFGKK
ncbi:MAG: hypothetical protein U9P50_00030 [Patescibacteria group bacterium]|nr:hypothetical protein [Patescibacteria group bacterium]